MNKNTIPSGLLAILFVVAMIWEFIKIIWPFIIAIILGMILYYSYTSIKNKREKEKKELYKKIKKLEKQINQYEKDLIECDNRLGINPNDVFAISYKEQLPYFIDNVKIELSCLTDNKMSFSEKDALNNRKQSNSSFLSSYSYNDNEIIDQFIIDKLIHLNGTITSMSKSDIWRIVDRQKSSYYFFWSSMIKRNIVTFKKAYFNNVIPQAKCEVYSISILGTSFYFYPKYVVQAKSKINYCIINYSQLSTNLSECVVIEENYNPKGGASIGYKYEHTCVDGTPDLRYKYNMKFSKYKYGYLIISSLENFRIEIANYNLATDLYKAIVDMKHTSKGQNKQHNNQNNSSLDNKSVKRNNIQPSVYDNKAVNNERKEFRDIMCRIIEKEGREIITQKRFVYMLEDLYSLQETPHVKHVLNLMLADGYMQKLLLKDKNTNLSYLSAQFSQKYMLRVDAVSEIFEDVMAVI